MTKTFLAVAMSAVVCFPALGQQTKLLTAEKHNEYGLVYSLPTTALQISVTARRETRKAGPYQQYAKRFTGYSNVVTEDEVKWSITDISVEQIGVKGDSPQYLMQLKAGATTYIGVSADGFLLSINAAPENPDFDIDGSIDKVGKLISGGGNTDDYLKFVDMDFVSAQNSLKQAEMIASSLMEIRETKLDLKSGNSDNPPSDGRQLELMLKGLDEQEEALSRAFTGAVTIEEFSAEYIYIPEDEGEEILFRLSNFRGFTDYDDYSGSPVYIKTEIIQEGEMPQDINGETKKFPKDGVVYGIPGTAKITIFTDKERLYSAELPFSQFGTTFGLSPSLFTDKKSPSYARFSPVTGAVVEIGTVSKTETRSEASGEE